MIAELIRRPTRTSLLVFSFALGLCACAYAQAGDAATGEQAAAQAMSEGRYGEAVALYRALSAASPRDAQPLLGLAAAYTANQERMAAVATLRKATTLAPRLPSGWYALGRDRKSVV